jgi:exosortase/archaeosortase family protein
MPPGPASFLSGSRRRVAVFVAKVLAFYGVWYVLYDLWLLPDGTVDRWLSLNVASVAGALLEVGGFEAIVDGRSLLLPDVRGVRIANGCNGLSTLGLFVGFVLAYPGRAWRRAWFIPLGIFAIYATNVGRIVVMLLTQRYWPAAFEPLHGFGLTTIFYVVVFGLWVAWAHYGGAPTASAESPADPPPDQAPAVSPS